MILVNGQKLTPTIFPDGTSQVWKLPDFLALPINIRWEWESEAEVMHIAQLLRLIESRQFIVRGSDIVSTAKDGVLTILPSGAALSPTVYLDVPYLPYARQDKEITNETCFALDVFFDILQHSSLGLNLIVRSIDPHSEKVDDYCFYNKQSPQHYIEEALRQLEQKYGEKPLLVFPDKGAYGRYANMFPSLPSIYFDKNRDPLTGEITSIEKRVGVSDLNVTNISDEYSHVLVVDDICDGGRTFTTLAEHLPNLKRHLYVTHGIFSKGIDALYDGGYDSVFVVNDLSTRIFSTLQWRKK